MEQLSLNITVYLKKLAMSYLHKQRQQMNNTAAAAALQHKICKYIN